MNIEAKPPVRRGPGGGMIVLAIVGVVLCVPLLIVGAIAATYAFSRSSRTEQVVYVPPAYQEAATYTPISPDFEARLDAANRIQTTSERDAALAVLAAEFSSNPDEANRAIQGIQNGPDRDKAAWDAAKRFSDSNRPQDAVKMIETMLDQRTRDAGFRAVATGDWPDRLGAIAVTEEAATEEHATEAVAGEAAY